MTSKFEGFEKSAPRGIPTTKMDSPGAPEKAEANRQEKAEAPKQKSTSEVLLTEESVASKKKRRRVGKTQSAQFSAPKQVDQSTSAADSVVPQMEPELTPHVQRSDKANGQNNRVESAWDTPSYPSVQEFAKAFVDHTESMLTRVLEKRRGVNLIIDAITARAADHAREGEGAREGEPGG